MINVVDDNMYAQLKKMYNGDASAASRAKAKLETMSADSYNQMVGKINEKYGNTSTPTVSTGTTNTTSTKTNTSNVNTNTSSANKNTSSNATKASVPMPEYEGIGGRAAPKDRSWDTGNGQYTYNPKSGYYEMSGNQTSTTSSTNNKISVDSLRNTWDSYDYKKQQELLNKNPGLQDRLTKYGITNKQPGESGTVNTPAKEESTPKTKNPDGTNWDYQDNSQERMDEIIGHLDDYTKTNPGLFSDYDTFYNAFIAGKGRTPEQEKVINDFFKKMKKYGDYDNKSSDEMGYLLAHGEPAEDYLSYLKQNDPQRWAEIQAARKEEETKISNDSYLKTVAEGEGFDMGDSDFWTWNREEMGYRDANKDGLDDRLYHEPTEEEKKLWEEDANYEAERLKIQNAYKNLQSDLTDQYPDADLSTIMVLTSDRGNKMLKALDTLSVSQTKVQGMIKYMQTERTNQDNAGQKTIAEIQKNLGMYYDYTPQGMSELAQAQYAATNVTLDQADNGTDTQKQMALDSVLTDYFDKYGSIIQRSKSQVINDVMAYAKKNGVSLSQALEDNFLKFLRQKPEFATLSSGGLSPTVSFEKVGDTGYIFTVNPDGTYSLESVGGTAIGSGVAGGTYNSDTGVMNFTESGMKGAGLKNNNPGNITDSNVGEVGRNGKFAVFETPEDGFDALVAKIQNAQNGKSKNYPATATLYEFFDKYAPASDNNNPKAYAESVAKQLGVSANTQIKDLDTVKFAAAIAKHDSGYNYDTYGMFRGGSGDNNNGYDPLLKDFFQKDPTKLTKDQWAKIKNMGYDERTYLSMRDNYLKNLAKEPDASTVKILDTLGYLMTNYPGREELMASIGTKFLPGDYGAKMGDYLSYVDYIKQNLTMDNLVKLKQGGATFGSLTEGERPRIEASATRLSNSMSKDKYLGELLDIYNTYAKNAGMGELTLDDINRMYGSSSSSSGTPTIKPMKGMEQSTTVISNNGDVDWDSVVSAW